MNAPPRSRPVSHRAAPPLTETARRLVPPLVAVTAVVAVIFLLLFLNSRPAAHGPGPAVVATGPASTSAAPRSAAPSPTGRAATAPSPSGATVPVAEPPATQSPAVRELPVTVLNNSRRTGLAHDAARQVARRGWPVAGIGNFTGRIPESTIYYAPGQRASAEAFARRFPAVRRVRPRFAGLPGSGLTLVVTRDWPA